VDAPVIIEQGRNDTRCPARPVELYEARLRELGKPVEVHWFDSGHLGGFAEAEKGIDEQRRFMDFAERVLERS
jgi:dipeptidyl aminopeptidase/acylaminoacyl peptidase